MPKLSRSFSSDLSKQMLQPMAKAAGESGQQSSKLFGQRLLRGLDSPLKQAGGLVAGAFAAKKVLDFFTTSIAQARESNQVNKQTEAAIRSTGGAAKVTTKQVSDLATAISNKTGKDDEAIQAGANMILTFKGIRNEAGKGNDIFNQTVQVTEDMTAAMNGGVITQENMRKTSIAVGKAMNDPIAGLTALRRVGVTFTEQQQEQIKTLVKSGDTLSAQKIILAEVRKEFGGSAAASATAADKLRVRWGNLQEAAGNLLIPILDRLATVMLKGADVVGRHAKLFGVLGAAVATMTTLTVAMTVASKVATAVQLAARGATIAYTAAQWLLNAALTANPIGLVVVGLAALAGGLVYAYRHSETFRKIVAGAFDGVKASVVLLRNVAVTALQFLANMWLVQAGAIVHAAAFAFGWVPGLGPKLKTAAREFDLFKDRANAALDRIKDKSINVTATANVKLGGYTKDLYNSVVRLTGRASGGLTQTGEVTLVGEKGPELVRLPPGSYVFTAEQTSRLLRGGMAKGGPVGALGAGLDRFMTMAVTIAKAMGRGIAEGIGVAISKALAGLTAGGPLGPASGNVIRLALAQAKRMTASFKVALALIEAGIVESGLRNLPYGDRDSLGFLQQRPSQGWRHPMNITYAAWDFLRRAIPIQGRYATAGMLAQAVQRSAFPARYDAVQARALGILNAYGFDQGGVLPPGLSLSWNGLGRPEPLVPAGAGPVVEIHNHFEGPILGAAREVARELAPAMDVELRKRGWQVSRNAGGR